MVLAYCRYQEERRDVWREGMGTFTRHNDLVRQLLVPGPYTPLTSIVRTLLSIAVPLIVFAGHLSYPLLSDRALSFRVFGCSGAAVAWFLVPRVFDAYRDYVIASLPGDQRYQHRKRTRADVPLLVYGGIVLLVAAAPTTTAIIALLLLTGWCASAFLQHLPALARVLAVWLNYPDSSPPVWSPKETRVVRHAWLHGFAAVLVLFVTTTLHFGAPTELMALFFSPGGMPHYYWLVYPLGAVVVVSLSAGTALIVAAYPLLELKRFEDSLKQPGIQPLDRVLEDLRGGAMFIGFYDNGPFLMHPRTVRENGQILGSSGSLKTTMLQTMLIQDIREGEDAILILDHKRDMVTYQTARREAGERFVAFTLGPGWETVTFDALGTVRRLFPDNHTAASFLGRGMGLELGGQVYGADHFAKASEAVVSEALNRPGPINDFNDLYRADKEVYLSDLQRFGHGTHALNSLDLLRRVPQLYPGPNGIDLVEAVRGKKPTGRPWPHRRSSSLRRRPRRGPARAGGSRRTSRRPSRRGWTR